MSKRLKNCAKYPPTEGANTGTRRDTLSLTKQKETNIITWSQEKVPTMDISEGLEQKLSRFASHLWGKECVFQARASWSSIILQPPWFLHERFMIMASGYKRKGHTSDRRNETHTRSSRFNDQISLLAQCFSWAYPNESKQLCRRPTQTFIGHSCLYRSCNSKSSRKSIV